MPEELSIKPKVQMDGQIQSPDEALDAQKEALETRHKAETERLEKQHADELAMLDPQGHPVDSGAFDATRPRGPEAPFETLKPSQRQGEVIAQSEDTPAPPKDDLNPA